MSWYSRLILIFIIFLTGCATNQPQIGKKVIKNEDELIIKTILAENNNHLNKAINILEKLYKKTNKYIYLEEIIKNKFIEKKYKEVITKTNNFIKKYPKYKTKVIKYKILSYLKLNQTNKALKIAKEVLKQNRSIEIYNIIAYIYIIQKKYKKAISYLKSAYSINHSPIVLAQMGDLFFKYLNNPNEAISYYQTHIRLYGCGDLICNKLANIYKSLYDYQNLTEIYKKLFSFTNEEKYARKIISLYIIQKKYETAINFIKENRLSNDLLIAVDEEALKVTKKYQYAYKLYKLTHDLNYFFIYAVTKFENSKKGLIDLKNLEYNLYFLISKDRNPKYLNYLGYILIDYDINHKKGLQLVKEAVKKAPNNIAFLDSLAWGYYKLHNCKKAFNIIKNINSKDKEILKHKKLIRRCYEYFRKNNKKNRGKSKKR
jgi:predicted Zn-dependent protease